MKRITSEEMHFFHDDTNNMQIILISIVKNFWILLVAIGLIFLLIFLYKRIKYHSINIKNNIVYYPLNILILLGVFFLCIGGIRGGFGHGVRPYTLSNAIYYTKSPQNANLILSNPFCFIRTLDIKKLQTLHYYDSATVASIFTANHYPKYSKINLGKRNIVIFILESFSKEHSKFLCPEIYKNDNGYTPFLDSLMQEGYTFTNAFANGRKSIEAMPSILASIPSYSKSFVLLPQSLGKMNALPKMLADIGYTTSFFCGAEKNSMGFEAFALQAGIQRLYSKEDYEHEQYAVNQNTIEPLWGVFDMPFYLYMADKMDTMHKPFFVSVFNLTSHHPFVVPSNYTNKIPKGYTKEQPCVAYTDMSIRKLFDKIKQKRWFHNTIFVFVADHVSSEIYTDVTKTPKGNTAIVLFMYTPDKILKGIDNHIVQQADIMPTLLGLIGNQKPYFAIGRDIFNEAHRMPIATNFLNQLYQCITDSITIYFDGINIQSAFKATDILEKNNVIDTSNLYQRQAAKTLKAILQTYYDRLQRQDYICP